MGTEWNFDGLPGPTHNFAGLAVGNLASERNKLTSSNPKKAALQSIAKMRTLADLGIRQAVFPPHERPLIGALRNLGFHGDDVSIMDRAKRDAPELFYAACSTSAMWTANAATVSPSADTGDGRAHFTPANLTSQFHRALETEFTGKLLEAVFPPGEHFAHHPALESCAQLRDEGAANHLRLCAGHGTRGIEVFVWGEASGGGSRKPVMFPARQTREASEAVARLHLLETNKLFLQQNPDAIDSGVFHNDVVAVSNENLLLYHSEAFLDAENAVLSMTRSFPGLHEIAVTPEELSLADAIDTYLFNSQIVTLPDGRFILIAPTDCRNHPRAHSCIERILAEDNRISQVTYLPVRESMKNGGGPACLRLRVVLTREQEGCMNQGAIFDDLLEDHLKNWVERNFRDHLTVDDLHDPQLLDESRRALDELSSLLGLGSLYPFQQ